MTAKKSKKPARKSVKSVSTKTAAKTSKSKKPAATKAVKKAAAKKPAATKAVKKAAAKKPAAKKAVKKATAKKPAATKAVKKATAKKPAATKAVKKAAAKKPAAKKAVKKVAVKKPAAKKATARVHHGGAVLVSSKRAKGKAGDTLILKRRSDDDFSLVKSASKKKRTKSYGTKDLEKFRVALEQARAQLMEQVNYLRDVSLKREDIGFSEEDGTDAFQRQVALNLAGREGDSVTAINDALRRIDEGIYGVCEECSCLIEKKRLEALPFASLCIACKSESEKLNGGRR
jgi:histone H1/5